MGWREAANEQCAEAFRGPVRPTGNPTSQSEKFPDDYPASFPSKKKSAHGRAARVPGEMNKLERQYAALLEARRITGEIQSWKYEPFKLRLAKSTFFDIDFSLIFHDGHVELHEVKGHWEDDARVKIKVAAEMFPEFKFFGVRWNRCDGWAFEEFQAGKSR